jgi:PAS domain S-box-containing protein
MTDHKGETVWNILNYLNLFVLILDSDMNVKLANYYLATFLGYKSEDDLIGESWFRFIREDQKEVISDVHKNIKSNTGLFREFTNEIITLEGKEVFVKWFNSNVNHELNYTFSIGIPLTNNNNNISPNDSIDSIRSYYRDILEKDRSMIDSIREMVIKNK